MKTAQEKAWAGAFGDAYHDRSPGNEEANFQFFRGALYRFANKVRAITPKTILELGAGTGANVRALSRLYPDARITALELNQYAIEKMLALPQGAPAPTVVRASVLEWEPSVTWDLVLTKGLLIHIHPDLLPTVYDKIHQAAARWILIAEYYNPTPVAVPYRGEIERLWKRDFAGEMLERFADLRLIDYGFVYHRDAVAPQDDVTWFLLEKP